MSVAAPRIIYTPARRARVIGEVDVLTMARRIDQDYRLQLNPDQVLWEEAKRQVNGGDIVRLCVDSLCGRELHRVHVYGHGEFDTACIVFVAAQRCADGRWVLVEDRDHAYRLGMDLLFEVCRDEVIEAWEDLENGPDMLRLLDGLAVKARRDVLDCHWTPERAAKSVVDDLILSHGGVG